MTVKSVLKAWDEALGPKGAAFMRAHYRELGTIGGHARAKALSKRRRKAIAKKAAEARWAKNGSRRS